MLTTCSAPGCRTIVMGGGRCLVHELHVARVFLRGRPLVSSTTSRISTMRPAGEIRGQIRAVPHSIS